MSSAVISGHHPGRQWAHMMREASRDHRWPSERHLARGFDLAMGPPLNVACSTRTWKVLARDRVQRAEHAFEADARRDVERMHIREEGRRATCIGMPYNTRDESAIISTKVWSHSNGCWFDHLQLTQTKKGIRAQMPSGAREAIPAQARCPLRARALAAAGSRVLKSPTRGIGALPVKACR